MGLIFISFPLQIIPHLCPKLPSGSRSSHEIITIGDSPVTKNPPLLLSTLFSGLRGVQSSLLLVLFLSFKKTEMRVHSESIHSVNHYSDYGFFITFITMSYW